MKEQRRYKYWADALAWFHFVWILVVVISVITVALAHRLPLIGLITGILTLGSWVFFRCCLLRVWENKLRSKYSHEGVYHTTFTAHYLKKLFGIEIENYTIKLTGLLMISFVVLALIKDRI